MRERLSALESVTNLAEHGETEDRAEILRIIKQIGNLNNIRNDLFHYRILGVPSEISVFKATARDKVNLQLKEWDRAFVTQKGKDAENCSSALGIYVRNYVKYPQGDIFAWTKKYKFA